MLAAVIPTQGKRLLLALTFTTFGRPACAGANRSIGAGAPA
jgi:hypothetical protein